MTINNVRGNVMITTLVILGVITVSLFTFVDSFKSLLNVTGKQASVDLIQVIHDGLIGTIENDAAWRQTILSGGLNCLAADGNVCPNTTSNLNVFLADGTLIANGAANNNLGFDVYGVPCTGFHPTIPNNNCPFKITFTWRPVCSGACPPTLTSTLTGVPMQPAVEITTRVLYSGTDKTLSSINYVKRFTKTFTRGGMEGTLAAACRSAGGDFDPANQKCKFQVRNCASNEIMVGFDSKGNPVCTANRFLDTGCGPTFAPTEIESGGRLKCWKF